MCCNCHMKWLCSIWRVHIPSIYSNSICLRIHYITSFCILCIPTYFSLYLCVYIFRESFLQESYIPHISLKEQQRVVSIEHSLYYTQAFSRSISNYMSNFRKLYFDRKSTTEKQPWNVNTYNACIVKLQVNSVGLRYLGFFHYDRKVRA